MNAVERKTIEVDNDVREIARVLAVADEYLDRSGVAAEVKADVTLALDEIVSNVIRHGGTEEKIQVHLAVTGSAVEIVVEDDGKAFNPLTAPTPLFDVPIEERRPGGMGIFLTKHMMSELSYRRESNRNILTMRRKLDAKPKPGTVPAA